MVVPFNQAWILLKQRGHELSLPEPKMAVPFGFDAFNGKRTPQELTDMRVDEGDKTIRAFKNFNRTSDAPTSNVSNFKDAQDELDFRDMQRDTMEQFLSNARASQNREDDIEGIQRRLDQQTLARMGQQSEADEMEAMGVPEMDETGMPMSRTLSARPPPNIGRAGSSGRPPVGSDDMSENLAHYLQGGFPAYARALDQFGPTKNPFPKPVGQNVRGDLMDWAAGAGRRGTGKPAMPEKIYPEEMMEEPLEGFHNSPAPADESAPTQMDMPNTVTTSPRMSRKNRPNASAPTARMQGRENRKGLPFGQ